MTTAKSGDTTDDRRTSPRKGGSLTEQAYRILREKVIFGELAPGTDVSEPELAEKLAMSKTPVREALARLCVEGFMEAYPRRGYRVTSVTIKDMNDLFAVRGVLEGTAAALAARTLTDAELDALDRLAEASYTIGEDASTRSFVQANHDFHAAIAKGSGNARLHAMVVTQLEECARLFYMGTRIRDINPETNGDHREILAALRARDPERARRAMVSHNDNTWKGLLSALVSNAHPGLTL